MRGSKAAIGVTLADQERVIESLFDSAIRLYYRRVLDGQHQAGVEAMARDRVKVWYDAKGDYLEVLFDQRPGYFRETTNDQVMEKVDTEGNVLGFSILKVSGIGAKPIEVAL
jgi:uncharacterized protein YuzE